MKAEKVYINLPSMHDLEKLLASSFTVSDSISGADVVITEGELSFINGKLVICVSYEQTAERNIFINRALSTETIFAAIKASIDTYAVASIPVSSNPAYHVLKDSDARVGYLVEKLTGIMDAVAESIVEIDRSGAIVFHNKKFAEVYDVTEKSVEGNIYYIFDENTVSELRQIIASMAMSEVAASSSASFSGYMKNHNGVAVPVEGYISALPGSINRYELIFDDITDKIKSRQETKRLEEQSVIVGFARHISHNVMNALTAAGGFIRQVQSKTENSAHMQSLWHIINDKLLFIEEVVAGYNDYTHAVILKKSDKTDLASFFESLIMAISMKYVDRNFTAYLHKFTDSYSLTYDFSAALPFEIKANNMFLKLAFCYILKDNIRYFSGALPLEYKVTLSTINNEFIVSIVINNAEVSEHIIATMLKPWDHKMLSQSFDYWGILIAQVITENHNGHLAISRDGVRLKIDMVFEAEE